MNVNFSWEQADIASLNMNPKNNYDHTIWEIANKYEPFARVIKLLDSLLRTSAVVSKTKRTYKLEIYNYLFVRAL